MPTSVLIQDLCKHFNATPAFVDLYMEANYPEIDYSKSAKEWLATLSAENQLYVSYALSVDQRAEYDVAQIDRYCGHQPIRRHLDIGCGYGGLLKAYSKRGAKCVGIEISEQLYLYSKANTADHKVDIIHKSVLDIDIDALGTFDLITCTDVIEHVDNPEELMRRMAKLLASDGTLYLHIPNGRSLNFVREDGHFLLFGITLLSRQEAKHLKNNTLQNNDDYNHMGEYFSYNYYCNHLRNAGLNVRVSTPDDNFISQVEMVPNLLAQTATAYEHWHEGALDLPYFCKQNIMTAYADYLRDFNENYATALRGQGVIEFVRDYLTDFWEIIGRKQTR